MKRLLLCFALLNLSASASEVEVKRVFRAGAATSNITPELGTPLIGGFNPRGSTHIPDDLHPPCPVLAAGAVP